MVLKERESTRIPLTTHPTGTQEAIAGLCFIEIKTPSTTASTPSTTAPFTN